MRFGWNYVTSRLPTSVNQWIIWRDNQPYSETQPLAVGQRGWIKVWAHSQDCKLTNTPDLMGLYALSRLLVLSLAALCGSEVLESSVAIILQICKRGVIP